MALEQATVLFVAGAYFFLRFLGAEGRADAYRHIDRSPQRPEKPTSAAAVKR